MAVGEGEAGGESDADFLLLGDSLLRVYREDMIPAPGGSEPGRAKGRMELPWSPAAALDPPGEPAASGVPLPWTSSQGAQDGAWGWCRASLLRLDLPGSPESPLLTEASPATPD